VTPAFSRNIGGYSGVSLNMRKRWRVVLPVIGIILFSVVSYHSLRVDRETPSRYFWWSSIRLDSDPSNRRNWGAVPCQDSKETAGNSEPNGLTLVFSNNSSYYLHFPHSPLVGSLYGVSEGWASIRFQASCS
jgi:hypothetical protein